MNSKKKGNLWENRLANYLRDNGVKAWKDGASGAGSREKGDIGNNLNMVYLKLCNSLNIGTGKVVCLIKILFANGVAKNLRQRVAILKEGEISFVQETAITKAEKVRNRIIDIYWLIGLVTFVERKIAECHFYLKEFFVLKNVLELMRRGIWRKSVYFVVNCTLQELVVNVGKLKNFVLGNAQGKENIIQDGGAGLLQKIKDSGEQKSISNGVMVFFLKMILSAKIVDKKEVNWKLTILNHFLYTLNFV